MLSLPLLHMLSLLLVCILQYVATTVHSVTIATVDTAATTVFTVTVTAAHTVTIVHTTGSTVCIPYSLLYYCDYCCTY